jgi:hypothetical protein
MGIQKGKQEVRRLQAAILLQSGDPLENLLHVWRGARKRSAPAVPLRPVCIKGRQVDMVCALLQILHIEEGTLPLFAGLFPLQSEEVRRPTRVEGGRPAHYGNGVCRLSLEVDQPAEQLDIRPDA